MKPRYIILHHSLTADSKTVSWQAIRKYHTETLGWRDIGYHFGIELINNQCEILVGRMLNEQGAHCKQAGRNRDSIGICFVGNFDNEEPHQDMWNLGVRLVAGLCASIGRIYIENIFSHHYFAQHKSCPGTKFNTGKFRNEVKDIIERGE